MPHGQSSLLVSRLYHMISLLKDTARAQSVKTNGPNYKWTGLLLISWFPFIMFASLYSFKYQHLYLVRRT